MALGGGTFTSQNKILPGSYINFVSVANATATLSDRGYATLPLKLDWGQDGAVFTVTVEAFQKNCQKLFGYPYTHQKLKHLRDLFRNVQTLYCYRLNSGEKARCDFAVAKHSGKRGNDLQLTIYENVDDASYYDVTIYLDGAVVESHTAQTLADLPESDYVDWIVDDTPAATYDALSDSTHEDLEDSTHGDLSGGLDLSPTAGVSFTGGTNGTVTGTNHQTYLEKIEPYSYNTMGVVTTDDTVKSLYLSFVKRMRDDMGSKFQLVCHGLPADYEGVINVKNQVLDDNWSSAGLVYWVTGLQSACAVNKSCLNRQYDGEFTVDSDYTQAQLVSAISQGEFCLHQVGSVLRVLADCNSLITITEDKGEIFKENQTMRVCDQTANDIAVLFNEKYLGNIANDQAGRISLWADIVKYYQQLQTMRAIEGFSEGDVTVAQGDSKKSVVVTCSLTVVNAMAQMYMTVHVA